MAMSTEVAVIRQLLELPGNAELLPPRREAVSGRG
jgi:hypothetical protein